jgi:hypothetical protein
VPAEEIKQADGLSDHDLLKIAGFGPADYKRIGGMSLGRDSLAAIRTVASEDGYEGLGEVAMYAAANHPTNVDMLDAVVGACGQQIHNIVSLNGTATEKDDANLIGWIEVQQLAMAAIPRHTTGYWSNPGN